MILVSSGSGDYIPRQAAREAVWQILNGMGYSEKHNNRLVEEIDAVFDDISAADVRPVPDGGIGEMSDGYHTFNGLYYQRMVLFAALVNAHKDKAWKSWKHEDGEPCFGGGWFIVGIDTPEGSYTYHYEEKDWVLFDCVELPVAKHWDGHTEEDVTRLLSLHDAQPRWIPANEQMPELHGEEYLDEVTGEVIRYKESNPILIWLENGGFMDIGIYEKSDAIDDFCYQGVPATVTYWMPLPEPPKEE